MKQSMMLDVAFTIETERNFSQLTQVEILAGLTRRLASLIENWEPEAIGFCDSYEIEED